MKTILAFFGYVKIPVSVIQLSIRQEDFLKFLSDGSQSQGNKELLLKHHEGQKAITEFLRSGKLID